MVGTELSYSNQSHSFFLQSNDNDNDKSNNDEKNYEYKSSGHSHSFQLKLTHIFHASQLPNAPLGY